MLVHAVTHLDPEFGESISNGIVRVGVRKSVSAEYAYPIAVLLQDEN